MRAKQFIREYSREKTQQVHGEKIIQAIEQQASGREN